MMFSSFLIQFTYLSWQNNTANIWRTYLTKIANGLRTFTFPVSQSVPFPDKKNSIFSMLYCRWITVGLNFKMRAPYTKLCKIAAQKTHNNNNNKKVEFFMTLFEVIHWTLIIFFKMSRQNVCKYWKWTYLKIKYDTMPKVWSKSKQENIIQTSLALTKVAFYMDDRY